MAAYPDVDQALRHLRAVSDRMLGALAGLSVAGWDGPTNCPPWSVRDLVVHVVASGDAFLLSAERGVAGSIEAGPVRERHKGREAALAKAPPDEIVVGLVGVTRGTDPPGGPPRSALEVRA